MRALRASCCYPWILLGSTLRPRPRCHESGEAVHGDGLNRGVFDGGQHRNLVAGQGGKAISGQEGAPGVGHEDLGLGEGRRANEPERQLGQLSLVEDVAGQDHLGVTGAVGGQALARYLLDNPGIVAGRRVLDVASGSGLVAIAAARAGAASVVAGDIDPHAVAAIAINAAANGVAVDARPFDLAADGPGDAEVVLAGDVFYQRELAELALRFLRAAVGAGADVLVADPGRSFLPADSLTALGRYQVPVLTAIEDAPVKSVTIYRLSAT